MRVTIRSSQSARNNQLSFARGAFVFEKMTDEIHKTRFKLRRLCRRRLRPWPFMEWSPTPRSNRLFQAKLRMSRGQDATQGRAGPRQPGFCPSPAPVELDTDQPSSLPTSSRGHGSYENRLIFGYNRLTRSSLWRQGRIELGAKRKLSPYHRQPESRCSRYQIG